MSNTKFVQCKEKGCDCKIEYTPGDSDVSGSFGFMSPRTKSFESHKPKKKKVIYLTCENSHTYKYIL